MENTSIITNVQENSSFTPSVASGANPNVVLTPTQLVEVVFFSVNTVVSLVGNCVSLAVFTRDPMRGTPSSTCLAVMAVADTGSAITGLLVSSATMFKYLPPVVVCHYLSYVNDIFVNFSVWSVVCFTVERYISVCHPVRASRIFSRLRQRYVVVLMALLPAGVYAGRLVPGVGAYEMYPDEEVICKGINTTAARTYVTANMMVRFSFLFAVPAPIIVILNALIVCRLRRHSCDSNLSTRVQQERRAQNASITRTLLLVSLLFFVCNFPVNVYFLIYTYDEGYFFRWVDSLCMMLLYMNFSGNLFVYALSGAKFRSALVELLRIRRTAVNSMCRPEEQQEERNGVNHVTP